VAVEPLKTLSGPAGKDGGQEVNYVAYVFDFFCSIVCKLYKLTLSDHAKSFCN